MIDLDRIKSRAAARLANTPPPTPSVANPASWLISGAAQVPISQLATLASNDESQPDPDRYCWPHSDAMNSAELDGFTARVRLFSRRGISEPNAQRLADHMVPRDRAQDRRRMCIECARLSSSSGQGWRCADHHAAGLHRDLPADLVLTHQICPAFKESRL